MYSPPRLIIYLLFLSVLLLAGISPALSFGGDGSISFESSPDPDPPPSDVMCTNNVDDNEYDGTDLNDEGCVKPIEPEVDGEVIDEVEGNIWDTDLAQVLGNPPVAPSRAVMFDGDLIRGTSPSDYTMKKSDGGSGNTVTENYVDKARPEPGYTYNLEGQSGSSFVNWDSGEPNDAGGEDCAEANYNGNTWNDIPCSDPHKGLCEYADGSYDTTASTSFSDARNTCQSRGGDLAVISDAQENNLINNNFGNVWIGFRQNPGASEPDGGWNWVTQEINTKVSTEDSQWGYGHDKEVTYDESDLSTDNANLAIFDSGKIIYPPNPSNGPACGDSLENQDSSQTGTLGHKSQFDGVTSCSVDYGEIYETYNVKNPFGYNPPFPSNPSCDCDSNPSPNSEYNANGDLIVEDLAGCEAVGGCDISCGNYGKQPCDVDYGNDRWENTYDCDAQHSKVSTAGSPPSGEGVRNDPGRTFTKFTAYDNPADDVAWCGWDHTTTVDADGLRGQYEGFVAIEDRNGGRIAGTMSHDGGDNVGKVWVAQRSTGDNNPSSRLENAEGAIDASCPGSKKVCLKYVDYYTKDSGWSTGSGGSGWWTAVGVDEEVFTAGRSYSVCKMINEVASNDGSEERIVNCDYYEDGEPVSPLDSSCGDDPREHLISAEGPQVNEDVMQNFPAFQQECVQYQDNSGPGNADSSKYDQPQADNPNGGTDGIQNVKFASIDKSSGIDDNDGYQDFTGTSTKLRPGNTYSLTVNIAMDGGFHFQYGKAWIDWDQSGSFESDEGYNIGQCSTDGCAIQTTIDVPQNVLTGTTMMRVFEKKNEYPSPAEQLDYGEAEDYSVDVTAPSKKVTENACVMDGEIYPEGSVVDVQDERSKFSGFEVPGDSSDPEVCVGINDPEYDDVLADDQVNGGLLNVENGDNGGEWWDLDNKRVTQYLRDNNVDSQEYKDYWHLNEDQNAKEATGIKDYHKNGRGMALEDDCAETFSKSGILPPYQDRSYNCEDDEVDENPVVGREPPFYAEFREGTTDDDYPDRGGLETRLAMVHNRVQSGGGTGHTDSEISRSQQTVQTDSDWNKGTQIHDMEVSAGTITSTEDRNNKDLDKSLAGEDVYGVYTSEVFGLSGETIFQNITVDYSFSGGTHPVVVEYSSDQSFSTIQHTETYNLQPTQNTMSFDLTPSTNHEYMRFKIGVAQAPTSPQAVFTSDESGSMSDVQDAVEAEIASFYQNLGSGSEGTVIGGDQGDLNPNGAGFTTNENDLETAANNLKADGGPERVQSTVEEAVNYNGAGHDYAWDATASRAVIWVQDGSNSESCTGVDPGNGGVGDFMISRNFKFYSATTGASKCRDYYDDLASQTGGETFDLSSSPNFDPILNSIRNDLNTIPAVASVDRVRIGSKTPPPPGGDNTQDDEPASVFDELDWHENAKIQPQDDEWALTPSLEWVIANNGTAWPPGQCHGALRAQGIDKHKRQAVYANSYARAQNDVYSGQASGGRIDGNWINPDRDTLSVTSGGITCDLTGHDWGYAVQTGSINGINNHRGSDFNREGDPTSSGTENVDDIIPVALTVEEQEFAWDMDSNPGSFNQDDLKQWKDACGDDRNEYLIREHAAKRYGEYNPTFSGRENYYGCADRPTDCVLDGEVYSEGQIVDVSDVTVETNIQSEDEEICIDVNDDLPGGEWWDVDNQSIRNELIGNGGSSNEVFEKTNGNTRQGTELYVREGQINPLKPGKIFWHDSNIQSQIRKRAIREGRDSPYSPLGSTNFYGKDIGYWKGYALEDDCDSDLAGVTPGCDDKGISITRGTDDDMSSDLIYSHFRESIGGSQVSFAIDETYSMRPVREQVTDQVKSFYEGFNTVEGTVVGSGCASGSTDYGGPNTYHCLNRPYPSNDGGQGPGEPRDTVAGDGLTSDISELKQGIENLDDRTSFEGPDSTIAEAVDYGPESQDYTGSTGEYEDESYGYEQDAAKGIIWIQDGGTYGTCDQVSNSTEGALGDYLVDNNFKFFAIVRDVSSNPDCRSNYEEAATNTGGSVYTLSEDPANTPWNNIFTDIRGSIGSGGIPVKADDFSTEDSWVVRMHVSGSTAHDSGTNQMNENTEGVNFDSTNWGWPTSGLNDSKIDPLEDTWAVSSETYDAVGPTGSVYDTGQCHGRSPPEHSEGWVLKNETVMANSFAKREETNSDDRDEGNWVDPDTTERTVSRGLLSCDLNSTDWGIGYDLGPSSSLNVYKGDARDYGYNTTDKHAVSGPIAFDYGEKPLDEEQDDLKQYPDACGDDQNEFLIREQYSSYHGGEIYPNLTDRDDIYACADRITDCAYNGAVYSEGQTLDISSQTSHNQEMGEQLPDEEICLDLNKSTPGGEWYDKDQEFTLEHRIKGLKDTYNVSNPSFTASTQIDISGVVEGESDGIVNITDTDTPVNSDGSFFMSNVDADRGEMQLLRYYNSTGQLEAQIRLRFPSDGSDVERVHLSPELMYDGSEVWSGMEKFSDHDFDRNKYHSRYNSTDWRNQDTRYDRTDLAYFNRTGGYYSPPSHRTNVRGQQKRYYSPEGYATEDDCGPLLSKSSTGPCGDVGDDTQNKSWFSAGNFTGMAP